MKHSVLKKLFLSLGFFALIISLVPHAQAIGIRPIRYEVNVKPGETIEGTVTVINETNADFSAKPSLLAFYKNDENGFPIFVSEKDPTLEDITTWVEVPQEPILVPAKGSTNVKYKVKVPDSATPGGKYVSIAYQPIKEKADGVTVNVRAASLLFLNVAGEVIKKGEVTNFSLPEQRLGDQPFTFDLSFKNTGNTHLKPTGTIELTELSTGKKLTQIASYLDPVTNKEVVSDTLPINLNQTNVLPNSDRIFKTEWTKNIKEGKFKAVFKLNYLPEGNPIEQSLEFEIKDDIKVDEFKVNAAADKADFDLTLSNQGLSEEKLKGSVIVTNSFNYKVAEIPLPADIEYIKPGETKKMTLSWLEKEVPTGRYTASLNATYGFTQKALTSEIQFGQRDVTKIILIVALVLVTGVALYSFLKKKRVKRSITHHRTPHPRKK